MLSSLHSSSSSLAAAKAQLLTQRFDEINAKCQAVDNTDRDEDQRAGSVLVGEPGLLIKRTPYPQGFAETVVAHIPQDGPAVTERFQAFNDAASHRADGSHRGVIEYSRTTHLPEGPQTMSFLYNPGEGTLTTIDKDGSGICEDIEPRTVATAQTFDSATTQDFLIAR